MGKRKSKPKKKTKAQKMATARREAGKTISQVKAANKKSMQDKARERNKAFQAAKKAKADAKKSAPKSIAKGTTGIGPVKSGKTYSKAVSTAKNQPTKKTTGIGPYADGAKYAAALKASPPTFKDGTKVAGNYTSPFANRQLMPDGTYGYPKKGDVINTGGKSGKDFRYDGKSFVPVKTAMLPGDNMGSILGTGAALGFGLSLPGMIKNAKDAGEQLKQNIERRLNPDADKVSAIDNLGGLGIAPVSAATIKSPDTFGYPSQAEVDKAAGITAGGLNIGGSGFTPSSPSGANARAIKPTGNPDVMSPDGTFNRPGPGGPEPEADYTSYQPGSFYNQSDTNMNPTNFLRSTRNVVTTPARMLGINNRFTNMLIPKSNEAIQDARDQRGPRPTLTRRGGGGGARLPVAPLTPEEILLPEVAQAAPAYQQALPEQTGVDPNRLMQIQQEAYAQAFNPYNPLTVGGFNPFFRFFGRRGGGRRGAFRRAFRRD